MTPQPPDEMNPPPDAPMLPQGTAYAGILKDQHDGSIEGFVWREGDDKWREGNWSCGANTQVPGTGAWHLAVPIEAVKDSPAVPAQGGEKCPAGLSNDEHLWSIAQNGQQECLWCHGLRNVENSQSSTPSTDAIAMGSITLSKDARQSLMTRHARTLERELAEAKQRSERHSVNTRWLIQRDDSVLELIDPSFVGTWQQRAKRVLEVVTAAKQDSKRLREGIREIATKHRDAFAVARPIPMQETIKMLDRLTHRSEITTREEIDAAMEGGEG